MGGRQTPKKCTRFSAVGRRAELPRRAFTLKNYARHKALHWTFLFAPAKRNTTILFILFVFVSCRRCSSFCRGRFGNCVYNSPAAHRMSHLRRTCTFGFILNSKSLSDFINVVGIEKWTFNLSRRFLFVARGCIACFMGNSEMTTFKHTNDLITFSPSFFVSFSSSTFFFLGCRCIKFRIFSPLVFPVLHFPFNSYHFLLFSSRFLVFLPFVFLFTVFLTLFTHLAFVYLLFLCFFLPVYFLFNSQFLFYFSTSFETFSATSILYYDRF